MRERLDYELGVITKAGYAGYFLIVADFIRCGARARHPGRARAAARPPARSSRTRCGITNVDPLKFDLLFERFLNPERVSMPDIDVDFCFERRGEVIEYVRERYGRDSVGQIVTFGTMKARAAVKDVGRVLGFTPGEADALAKLIPNQPGLLADRARGGREDRRGRASCTQNDERYQQLLDFAIAHRGAVAPRRRCTPPAS